MSPFLAKVLAAAAFTALLGLLPLFFACAADPIPLPTSPDDPASPAAPEAAREPPPAVLSPGSAAPAAPPPTTTAPVHHHHHSHAPSGSPK
jgi:hypothetical protein